MSRLVTVARCRSGIEAHSLRILLEASGIAAVVTGDAPSEHGFEEALVHVHQDDAMLAVQVIEEVPAASEVLIPEWICHCGATVDEGFHCCWSCGHELDAEGG